MNLMAWLRALPVATPEADEEDALRHFASRSIAFLKADVHAPTTAGMSMEEKHKEEQTGDAAAGRHRDPLRALGQELVVQVLVIPAMAIAIGLIIWLIAPLFSHAPK